MLPIRDHNPSERIPIVTWTLILMNVLIHLWVWLTHDSNASLWRLYTDWAMIPRLISQGDNYETLLTSTFLHGDFIHLGMNMLFLWIFGDNLEETLGRIGFLLFYLACGIAGSLAQWGIDPRSAAPTIGASGAIAGVMGGYLLLFPKAKVDVFVFLVIFIRIIPLNAWLILSLWFALQLIGGLGTGAATDGVAYWAHIGGFVAGLALMLPVWLMLGGPRFWERSDGHPPHPEGQWNAVRTSTIPQVRRDIRRRTPWGP